MHPLSPAVLCPNARGELNTPHGSMSEALCFAVFALVCDLLSKSEGVPIFARESERGPFVREIENRDEKRFEIESVTVTFWQDSWK